MTVKHLDVGALLQAFIGISVRCYGFPRVPQQPSEDRGDNDYSRNAFMKTEADVKVKLGGLLEAKLLGDPYTVHSELPVYPGNDRADLSIHRIEGRFLRNREEINSSLVAVTEIKYANFWDSDYDFREGKVAADIRKLASLAQDKGRYMLILDEGCRIPDNWAEQTRGLAREHNVGLFSNNPALDVPIHA